jgi:hypothetical protein
VNSVPAPFFIRKGRTLRAPPTAPPAPGVLTAPRPCAVAAPPVTRVAVRPLRRHRPLDGRADEPGEGAHPRGGRSGAAHPVVRGGARPRPVGVPLREAVPGGVQALAARLLRRDPAERARVSSAKAAARAKWPEGLASGGPQSFAPCSRSAASLLRSEVACGKRPRGRDEDARAITRVFDAPRGKEERTRPGWILSARRKPRSVGPLAHAQSSLSPPAHRLDGRRDRRRLRLQHAHRDHGTRRHAHGDRAAREPAAPRAPGHREKLQGTWEIIRYESESLIPDEAMPLMGAMFEALRIQFDGLGRRRPHRKARRTGALLDPERGRRRIYAGRPGMDVRRRALQVSRAKGSSRSGTRAGDGRA